MRAVRGAYRFRHIHERPCEEYGGNGVAEPMLQVLELACDNRLVRDVWSVEVTES